MNGQLKEIRHLRGIIGGLMSDIDAHKKLIREIKNMRMRIRAISTRTAR